MLTTPSSLSNSVIGRNVNAVMKPTNAMQEICLPRISSWSVSFWMMRYENGPEVLRSLYRYHTLSGTRDRKRDVSGKSVSVRVDLGGRRIIKTKIKKKI